MGGGGSQNTNTVTKSDPWAPQQDFIKQGLDQSLNIYNQNTAAGPYQGNFTAGGNQNDNNAQQIAGNFGQTGIALTAGLGNGAGELLQPGTAAGYLGNAQGIAANGIDPQNAGLRGTIQDYGMGAKTTQGATPALSSALNEAAINGAGSLNSYNSGLQGAASRAAADPTQTVANNAGIYMNSAPIRQALDSAHNTIDQTLTEQTLPGLNRAAAMGGSLNSSRAGMAEGMANEGAAIAKGQVDASIMNNAYNQGLGTAKDLYSSGINQSIGANTAGMATAGGLAQGVSQQQTDLNKFNSGQELNAANAGLGQDLAHSTADVNAQLAGNSQIGNALQMGGQMAGQSAGISAANAGLQQNAGSLQTAQEQAGLTNDLQQWNMQNQYQQGILNNYMNTAGQPLGSSMNSSGTSTGSGPGVAAQVVGGLSGAAGLAANGVKAAQAVGGLFNSASATSAAAAAGLSGAAAAAGVPAGVTALTAGSSAAELAAATSGAGLISVGAGSAALGAGSAAAASVAAEGAVGATTAAASSGWVASALAFVGSLFSDRRLKENIVRVGTENGHAIYDFNYIGGDVRFRGVMAQDVQRTHPEAVSDHAGYLAVNYDAIGVKMKRLQ